ncbi:uncharacterized protein I206_101815 [Kwoniella pini CBS 10737]|uniref:Uncharacterized protein n=1 Tax=Kwoniella pini CBS 10737 TaxID=1296096 RepID=A0A1B9HVM4_9TREE|nr:uncharacterized protein I206_07095 [Kwoniella pini CBS 10737]OCF47316.1 hypothetical protein I206_07095 [Kwoniella pini CBS 10737]
MMCIKHVLLYFFLLPIPAASPIFILLFTAAAFIAIKPCGYCLSLLAILFLSSSPHSPFLHPSLDSQASSSSRINSTSTVISSANLPLNAPLPNRTWMNLNGGRYSSPNLVGYEEMNKAISATYSNSTRQNALWKKIFGWDLGQSFYTTSNRVITGNTILDKIVEPYLPPSPESSAIISIETNKWRKRELPKNYFDMSWKGIGFVVDFGLKRSEDGIKWEIEEVIGKEWVRSIPDAQTIEDMSIGIDEEKIQSPLQNQEADQTRKGNFWDKVPILSSYW